MPIAVCCPGCQKRFNAPDALAGKRAKCSACGGIISIAAPAGPNDAPVAPVQVAPVKVVPVKVVPVKVVPVQTGPINGAPNQAAPIKVAPVRVVPTGSGPATAAGPKVVPTKAAAPRAAAPQATVSPAGGSSLLDLLDQAAAGGAAADPFAAGGYPAGGAKLARSGGRNRFVMPLVIGLGIVGVVGLVGAGITMAVKMLPEEDDSVAYRPPAQPATAQQGTHYYIEAEPGQKLKVSTTPPGSQPSAPAAGDAQTQNERDIYESMSIMRNTLNDMRAIVDQPTAEAGFPKLIEQGGKLLGLINRLKRMEQAHQLSAHELELMRQFGPEAKSLAAQVNSEKVRLQALATRLQMEQQFSLYAQAAGSPPPPQPPQPQFIQPYQQQPQYVPPQQQPQPAPAQPIGPRHRLPRQHGPRR